MATTRDLTGEGDVTVLDLTPSAKLVRITHDIYWRKDEALIFRHFCPPGVRMFSAGFSVLGEDGGKVRNNVRLTNFRNLVGQTDEEGNREHGMSWYLLNEGGAYRVDVEFSFVSLA